MTSANVHTEPKERKKPPTDGRRRKGRPVLPRLRSREPGRRDVEVTAVETQRELRCPECDQVVAVR